MLVDGNTTYTGGTRFTRDGTASNPITIRGERVNGNRPILSGGTNTVELNGNYYVFEGFEVTGGTSRCIYHHAHGNVIRDTLVRNCAAQGILGGDFDTGSLTMEYVEVRTSGSGTQNHPIYMSSDQLNYPGAVFRMQHCYVHSNNGGNAVKSRAQRNEIYYNWIDASLYRAIELIGDDLGGNATPEMVREDSDVVGNVIRQPKQFPTVRIGGDQPGAEANGRFRFVNNTFVITGAGAIIQAYLGVESIEMHNNIFFRTNGVPVILDLTDVLWTSGSRIIAGSNNWVPTNTAVPVEWTGTVVSASPGFVNAAGLNFALTSTSPAINQGNPTTNAAPGFEFTNPLALPLRLPPATPAVEPVGTALARPVAGVIDIGAFEFTPPTVTQRFFLPLWESVIAALGEPSVRPSPTMGAAEKLATLDGRLSGELQGNTVTLVNSSKDKAVASTYQAPNTATRHMLRGLVPGAKYNISRSTAGDKASFTVTVGNTYAANTKGALDFWVVSGNIWVDPN